jgi:hypothetical protein
MAWAAPAAGILGLVGAGIYTLGAVRQGYAQSAQANYEAQVAQNNQKIAYQNAAYASQAGGEATFEKGLQERAQAGSLTAGLAAHGVDVNTGSAADVRRSQAELGQLGEETTAQSAALNAYGYRTAATSFGAQSTLLRAEAPQDITAGYLSGAGTLLAGASNIGGKWGSYLSPTSAPSTNTGLGF